MSNRNERKIGLGWTAENRRVIAYVAVEDGSGVSTFTDHTEGASPARVSVSFEVVADHFGQIPAEDRVIVRHHSNDASEETRAFIEELWTAHHLNDMNAACEHMTADMLARHEGESASDWQTRMLDTVTCPESGYRWGRSWLARSVPADVLTKARKLIETGRV
jgi:hypothetical protein